jgi:hypothetical protein
LKGKDTTSGFLRREMVGYRITLSLIIKGEMLRDLPQVTNGSIKWRDYVCE